MKHNSQKRVEIKFLLGLLQPYLLKVLLFLSGSLLVSLFDGISIGLLIPIISIWQGIPFGGDIPEYFNEFIALLQPISPDLQLIILVVIVITAILLKNLLLGFSIAQGLGLSNQVAADARLKILDVLLSVNIEFHHKSKQGELLEKTINHIDVLKDIITSLVEFVVYGLMSVILLGMMFAISWQLTILSIFLGSILMLFLYFYTKRLSRLGERTAKTRSDLTQAVQENLGAVRLIQANNKQSRQLKTLQEKNAIFMKAEIQTMSRVHWITPLSETIGAIGIGFLIIISWTWMPAGSIIPLAKLLPFLYILLRNVQNLRYLNNLQGGIFSSWPYLSHIHEMVRVDNKPFIEDGKIEFTGLKQEIAFEAVSFAYDERMILEQASFVIPKGKTTAIVGESGAGKSTIANLLMRFYDPLDGAIYVDGRLLKDYQLASYREKIGIVSQDTFIFNQSVYTNIGFALGSDDVPRERVIEAGKSAGAHDFIMELPQGYDTLLGDRGVILSGGQKQRISIARAVLKDPQILILDEATSSLDTITERSIHQAILALQHQRTTIIIAHRFSTLQHADQIIVLKEGRAVESGTPQQLSGRMNEYFNLDQLN